MILNKNYIFIIASILFIQFVNCQTITNDKSITRKIIATKIISSSVDPKIAATNSIFRTATRSHILPTPVLPNSNDAINKNEPSTNETIDFSLNEGRINNSTLGYNNTMGLDEFDYEKPINWTSGYGTHYGPFPSSPHFSEVGYQPQDVGVGCSDGRPGGDPRWKNILSKGVYPPPNLVGHQNTVWPVAYTVAVSLAVWNKEDVCWKTLKIRNKNKPEYMIEAYIVDFCPIGYCQWKDKYLSRNVDIYGEKAWFALGADQNISKLEVEIEWPEGVVPHDALTLSAGFSRISKSLMVIVAPLISITVALFTAY